MITDIINRLRRYVERNRGRVLSQGMSDLASRAYCSRHIRTLVRPFIRPREPERWLFLVGCYNSGTTITRDILAAHPQVRGLPREGVRFTSVLPRPEDVGWTRMWVRCLDYMQMPGGLRPDLYRQIVRDWSPWWGVGGTAFMDKSIANITRMQWLDENFPNAYFLGIVRNGYCAAEGIRRRARPRGRAREDLAAESYSIEMAAEQWVEANQFLLRGANEVRRFFLIHYEDLVGEPIEVLRRIWTFFELEEPEMDFDDGLLRVADMSFQVRNMNGESLARLSSSEIARATQVIGGMQSELGYNILDA